MYFRCGRIYRYAAKCNIKRIALSSLVHPHSDACVQTVLPRSCIYVSPCLLRGRTGCTMRCFGAWELAMHHARRGSNSTFGANAPKRRCLCAICAKQAVHLRVLLPTERVNRLHHATLCCLGAGIAMHTLLYVILRDLPSQAYCIHTAMPVCNLCYLGHASMCTLAS